MKYKLHIATQFDSAAAAAKVLASYIESGRATSGYIAESTDALGGYTVHVQKGAISFAVCL
ncbi:MAG: hypothetical protein Q7V31_12010 [Parvibaculum sp.]|uniref:hypothetical protein n=1 Tax=Parvibaculum sp. TaxID=2024848 RepID=UPI002723D8E9|nr:hypothetical protein [Parvibaculum sp.]MDO8839641.1 hypothetical protein [Parvibaculum sp.]